MAKGYTISAVSATEPKRWQGQWGEMITYKIKVEGEEIIIELNKKPDSPAPKVGDPLYGDIQNSEYGYKFKQAQDPNKSFGGGGGRGGSGQKPGYQPKDDREIRGQMVVKAVASAYGDTGFEKKAEVAEYAIFLFNLVDQIKVGAAVTPAQATAPDGEFADEDFNTSQSNVSIF